MEYTKFIILTIIKGHTTAQRDIHYNTYRIYVVVSPKESQRTFSLYLVLSKTYNTFCLICKISKYLVF